MRRSPYLLMTLLLAGCTNLIFQPWTGQQLNPATLDIKYRDVFFRSSDGVMLHGWFLPAQGRPQGTVLFLHGNAQNISEHITNVYWLPVRGYNVLLFDYRGYGLSDGSPSLDGVHADAHAALAKVFSMEEVDPQRVVVLGQSLGAAIAVTALADSAYAGRVRGLAIDSSYATLRGIARQKLAGFWLTWPLQWPLSYLVSDRYQPIEAIRKIHVPVLIIGGINDPVVSIQNARALYAAAHAPKTLWEIPNIPHTGTFNLPEYRGRFVVWLQSVMGPVPAAPAAAAAHGW